jgi:protein subunit release factor A
MTIKITEDQFRFEWYSGTGPGGQHRNKHQNCCRCIHVPTGITATGANARSREHNKRSAYSTCLARVVAHFHEDKERHAAGTERIRTYHNVDNRVVDHASGHQDTWTNIIEKSNLEEMIDARAKVMR